MLTYDLKKTPAMPLYEALYRYIREDILSGKLTAGEKLPSKRALAAHLEVSKITVEGAYAQLLSEGYILSREKVGYFVEEIPQRAKPAPIISQPSGEETPLIDLTGSHAARFPFSVWSRLQREVMLDLGEKLLQPMPHQGVWELRQAISRHLAAFRGMQVSESQILIGSGTDFLYNLLVQLLGREKRYCVEEPGYSKIRRIYRATGAEYMTVSLDEKGVIPPEASDAQVLHISPNHHFPTGVITSLTRRQEILNWAYEKEDRWIIEDEYDSEFRFHAHPMPSLQSLDRQERVIYMNTFSRSLAPSIRIGYMVLPPSLMEVFTRQLGFYSCTVPSFEQHTLARFLSEGYFEKHINRMRKYYKATRNRMLSILETSAYRDQITVLEENAGLHFLVSTGLSEEKLKTRCRELGLKIHTLADYYHGPVPPEHTGCLVVNYGGITEKDLEKLQTIFL